MVGGDGNGNCKGQRVVRKRDERAEFGGRVGVCAGAVPCACAGASWGHGDFGLKRALDSAGSVILMGALEERRAQGMGIFQSGPDRITPPGIS